MDGFGRPLPVETSPLPASTSPRSAVSHPLATSRQSRPRPQAVNFNTPPLDPPPPANSPPSLPRPRSQSFHSPSPNSTLDESGIRSSRSVSTTPSPLPTFPTVPSGPPVRALPPRPIPSSPLSADGSQTSIRSPLAQSQPAPLNETLAPSLTVSSFVKVEPPTPSSHPLQSNIYPPKPAPSLLLTNPPPSHSPPPLPSSSSSPQGDLDRSSEALPRADSSGVASGLRGFFGFGKSKDTAEDRKLADLERSEKEYLKQLALAQSEDLGFLDERQMVYHSGSDLAGRPIVVVVAQRIPAKTVDNMMLLRYFIRTLDPLVNQDYVIVYVHTGFRSDNQPPFSIFKKSYGLLSRKYKKNLKNVYLLQPTWWVKLVLKLFKPIISSKFYRKIVSIDRVEELFKYMNRHQVKLPITMPDSSGGTPELRYFAEDLPTLMLHPLNRDHIMPLLVEDAVRYLSVRALQTTGIFRVSGNANEIMLLKKQYDSGSAPDLFLQDTEHVVAGLLKLFIRELPDPLFCYDLYSDWVATWGTLILVFL